MELKQLNEQDSLCERYQRIIVSEEKGKKHTADNKNSHEVRHYRLDGGLVKQQLCCDYLLLDDTGKKAYYIELKGKDMEHAVEQVIAGEKICERLLKGYLSFYRIVTSKSRTHNNQPSNFRKLLSKVGTTRFRYHNMVLSDTLN